MAKEHHSIIPDSGAAARDPGFRNEEKVDSRLRGNDDNE
jgi:hypothetical protein